jgi:hypothetical protein
VYRDGKWFLYATCDVAERTGRGITLEDLTGIRARVRLRKPQRVTLHSWAFAQLGQFTADKAVLAGCLWCTSTRRTPRRCARHAADDAA